MPQHQQFIPLDECIYGYIDQAELSNHKYFKLWNLAFRGLTDLGLDYFYQLRSVKLPLNANKTVNLPEDFLQYSKIGVLNANGEVIPLGHNPKLTNYASLLPDRLSKTQDDSLGSEIYDPACPVYYNYWANGVVGNLYGLPSGSPSVGSFKLDNHNGIILLDGDFAYDYIILEYIAAPKQGQEYYLPIQFKEALIAWLAWQDIAHIPSKTHVNNTNVGMRRHEYYNQRRMGQARYRPFHFEEAYEWNLQNQRMCIKG